MLPSELSPYFLTDSERIEAVLNDAYILTHEKKISSMKEFLPVLEQVAKQDKPFPIIAEDIAGEALATLVVNKLVARCRSPPSRRRASATAARRCCRTLRPHRR